MQNISVEELKERLDRGDEIFLLDVREQSEYDFCRLDAHLIPLNQLPARVEELDKNAEIVVYCHTGVRSVYAAQFLSNAGFATVKSLQGGIEAWSVRIDSSVPRY